MHLVSHQPKDQNKYYGKVFNSKIFTSSWAIFQSNTAGVVGSELFRGQFIRKKWLVPQNIRSPFFNNVGSETSTPLIQVRAPGFG